MKLKSRRGVEGCLQRGAKNVKRQGGQRSVMDLEGVTGRGASNEKKVKNVEVGCRGDDDEGGEDAVSTNEWVRI